MSRHDFKVGYKVITLVGRSHPQYDVPVEIGNVGEIIHLQEIPFLDMKYFVDFGGQYAHGFSSNEIKLYKEETQ